jgi:hypothetical protein
MKRNLSITTAAAALLIGTVFAAAQGAQRQAPAGGAEHGAQGQGPMQQQPRTQGQGGGQAQPAPEGKGKAQTKEPRTQGQGGQGQREGQPQQGQRDTQPKQGQPQQGQRDNQKGAQGKGGQSGPGVKLTDKQRTTIRQTVLQGGNRVTNVNFTINVGTVVPRSVRLVAVPAPLIEIHPAWRGHVYFIVEERIVIVEPSSHKIVAVLVV